MNHHPIEHLADIIANRIKLKNTLRKIRKEIKTMKKPKRKTN